MMKKLLALAAIALTALLILPPDIADARRGGGGGGGGGGFRAAGGGGHAFRGGGVRAPMARAWSGPRRSFAAPRFTHRASPRVVVRRPVYAHRRPVVRPFYRAPVVVVGIGRCEWLRRRAVITGSPYWWRRYDRCRFGY